MTLIETLPNIKSEDGSQFRQMNPENHCNMLNPNSIRSSVEESFTDAVADLEQRVHRREQGACEAVCAAFPTVTSQHESLLELIYTEYVLRQEIGEKVGVDEWFQRFPDLKVDLQELFRVHDFLESDLPKSSARLHSRSPDAWSDLNSVQSETSGNLGRFELFEQIGRGGMGVVYRAAQIDLGRIVAVKTITGVDATNPSVRSRFRAEAEAAASLQHPHIVQIFEVGIDEDQPYFSMEYVAGGNLAAFVREQPLEPIPAARLILAVTRAIHYAHTKGVIHRDIKPANILLAPSDRSEAIKLASSQDISQGSLASAFEPKVTDFGLARRIDLEGKNSLHGAPIGTPSYMSPEVAAGDSGGADAVSDVYSLGAVLYDVLVGRPPFHAATVAETLERVRNDDPVLPRRLQPNVPRDLETICLKCLRKVRSKRYQSALELADDLDRFLKKKPILARSFSASELIYKSCRRNPARFLLVVAISVGAIVSGWQWRLAAHHLAIARTNALAASTARDAEQTEHQKFQRTLYTHYVSLALFEHQANNTQRAAQLLEECPIPMRHWEWNYVKQKCQERYREFRNSSLPIRGVTLSRDGRTCVSASGFWGIDQQGELMAWNVIDGTLKWTKMPHPSAIMDVEFDSNGKRIVSTGNVFRDQQNRGRVVVSDAETGDEIWSETNSNSHAATFSSDDQFVVIAHTNGWVSIHDAMTGKEVRKWNGHQGNINDIAFVPGSQIVITTGRDGYFRIWDLSQERFFTNSISEMCVEWLAHQMEKHLLSHHSREASRSTIWPTRKLRRA